MKHATMYRTWLRAAQVAERLGRISRQRVQQYRKDGRLEGRETPLGWFYSPRSVAALSAALRRNLRSRLGRRNGAPR